MKKYLKKYKSKIKKLLYVFPILLVCISLTFAIPASALTTYYMTYDKPSADDYSGYMEVSFSDGGVITYFFKIVSFGTNINYLPYGEVNVTSSSLSVNFYIGGSSGEVGQSNVHLVDGFMANSGYNYINHSELSENYTLNCYFESGLTIKFVKLYGFLQPSYSSSSFVRGSSYWVVSYGSDHSISNQLNTIIGSLQQQNNDIIANADKNADEIQANQDKNTDKIINGGTDYGTVDKTQTNDYISKEEALNTATSQSRENTVSMFSNFGSFFTNSKLAKGLTGTTRIMSEFLQISWLSDMSNFALILGAFSFVIGAGMLIGGINRNRLSAELRRNRERSNK